MSEVPLYTSCGGRLCEDRVLDGPASGGKGSKGRNELDCIRGKGVRSQSLCGAASHSTLIPIGVHNDVYRVSRLRGYLVRKKQRFPRTLQ